MKKNVYIYIYVYTSESLCCTVEINNNIVIQLYLNKIKKNFFKAK